MNTRLTPFDDVRVRQAVNYAVDRNRLVEINGGPDNAQVGCQMLPPNTDGYRPYCPYTLNPNAAGTYTGPDLAKARRLVAASGTKGQPITVWFYDIPIGHANGGYIVSVLRSLGYNARLKMIPHMGATWRPNRQAGVGGWGWTTRRRTTSCRRPSRAGHTTPIHANGNFAAFCDKQSTPRSPAPALSRPPIRPPPRSLWSKIDREITERGPWVTIHTAVLPEFVSRRTGNYTYCFLSSVTGSTSACLDRLWVR